MTPEQIASLPVQALLIVAIVALWRRNNAMQDAHVSDLKSVYEKGLNDLRNRVMMIEDRLGIKPPLMENQSIPGAKLN